MIQTLTILAKTHPDILLHAAQDPEEFRTAYALCAKVNRKGLESCMHRWIPNSCSFCKAVEHVLEIPVDCRDGVLLERCLSHAKFKVSAKQTYHDIVAQIPRLEELFPNPLAVALPTFWYNQPIEYLQALNRHRILATTQHWDMFFAYAPNPSLTNFDSLVAITDWGLQHIPLPESFEVTGNIKYRVDNAHRKWFKAWFDRFPQFPRTLTENPEAPWAAEYGKKYLPYVSRLTNP